MLCESGTAHPYRAVLKCGSLSTEVGVGNDGDSFFHHTAAGRRSRNDFVAFTAARRKPGQSGAEVDEVEPYDLMAERTPEADVASPDPPVDSAPASFVAIDRLDGSPPFDVHVGLSNPMKIKLLEKWILNSISEYQLSREWLLA